MGYIHTYVFHSFTCHEGQIWSNISCTRRCRTLSQKLISIMRKFALHISSCSKQTENLTEINKLWYKTDKIMMTDKSLHRISDLISETSQLGEFEAKRSDFCDSDTRKHTIILVFCIKDKLVLLIAIFLRLRCQKTYYHTGFWYQSQFGAFDRDFFATQIPETFLCAHAQNVVTHHSKVQPRNYGREAEEQCQE